jgi:hypothetical protein
MQITDFNTQLLLPQALGLGKLDAAASVSPNPTGLSRYGLCRLLSSEVWHRVFWSFFPSSLIFCFCIPHFSFGLFSSSGVLENRKHDVSETGSVSVLRWRWEKTPIQLGPKELISITFWGAQLSRRLLPPSPEDRNRSSFRNVVFSIL